MTFALTCTETHEFVVHVMYLITADLSNLIDENIKKNTANSQSDTKGTLRLERLQPEAI